jgi:hypothetical protein
MKNRYWIGVLLISTLGIIEMAQGDAQDSTPWTCTEESWQQEPKVENGRFKSQLKVQCQFNKNTKKTFQDLLKEMGFYLKSERTVHGPVVFGISNGAPSFTYDTTVVSKEEQNLEIREKVLLATDNKERFTYQTQSVDIKAKGLASYLKSFGISAEVKRSQNPDHFEIELQNSIEIERPWYALPPIFLFITKGKAKEKFGTARNHVLKAIYDHL